MDFRRDINFLRAIAVVLVVLYHFGVPGFSGGFVGVDVFFVISGYLMTGILLKPQQTLLGFYAARGRRIIPALAVLCVVLLAAGAIFLTPADYVALSGQAGASIAFVSNISSWWREGDYFGPNANANWLLHTWSLSVEWQFYMLYPLFLIGVMRASRAPRVLGSAIAAALCLSLLLGIYFSPRNSIAAFYLLPMRAWELLLGGVICLARPSSLSPRWRVGGSLAGLLVIYASAAIFDGQDLWPHYWALIPTLGAALIIYVNAETALFRAEAVQFIGRASYSIYLWHWPVVVGLNYLDVAHSFAVVAGGIGLSLIAGALSYLYVETPSRKMLAEPSRARVRAVACFAAVPAVAAISLAVMKLEGLPNRVGSQVQAVLSEETNGFQAAEDCSNPERGCDIGQGSTMAVLWDDSHANALATAVAAALEERQGRVKMFFMGACPTVFGAFVPRFDQDRKCAEFNQKVWETVRRLPEEIPLIIANRTSVYIEGFNEMSGGPFVSFGNGIPSSASERKTMFEKGVRDTLCQMAEQRRVYVLAPVPEFSFSVPRRLARQLQLGLAAGDVTITKQQYLTRNEIALRVLGDLAEECQITVLDPTSVFCDADLCFGSIDGVPLYHDGNHLSERGNKRLIPMLRAKFGALALPAPHPSAQVAPPANR